MIGSGIRNEQPGSYFLQLRNHFLGLKYFNSLMRIRDPDPGQKKFGSGIRGSRIRDGKKSDPGSGKTFCPCHRVLDDVAEGRGFCTRTFRHWSLRWTSNWAGRKQCYLFFDGLTKCTEQKKMHVIESADRLRGGCGCKSDCYMIMHFY